MVVNYRHITPDIVYDCASHRNVLSIGEHAYLETAFGEGDMQEENKGVHSSDYYFGYLHPCCHLHFEKRVPRATKKRVKVREEGQR